MSGPREQWVEGGVLLKRSNFDGCRRVQIRRADQPLVIVGHAYGESREVALSRGKLMAASPAMADALEAIRRDPHGCRFCDSGILRPSATEHDDDCGYLLAETALRKAGRLPAPKAEPAEWLPGATAPRNATWIVAEFPGGTVERVHYTEDPAFRGWFKDVGGYYVQVDGEPVRWRPEAGRPTEGEAGGITGLGRHPEAGA